MSQGHFKLGLFVIVSVVLLVVMLLMLGMLDRFRPSVTMETYFFEPIEGLQTGAAVKLRGVPFGRVSHIGLVEYVYSEDQGARADTPGGSAVYVEMVIDAQQLRRLNVVDLEKQLASAVQRGLRARLSASGLGGPAFVQIDHVDPARFPVPELPWTPQHLVIPSAPSTVRSIVASLTDLLMDLQQADVVKKLGEMAELGPALNRLVESLEDPDVLGTVSGSLRELQAASAELRDLLADPRIDALLDETTTTLASARSFLNEGRDDVHGLVTELTTMADALESAAVSANDLLATVESSDLVPQLRTMANELGPAGRELSTLATKLERLVGGNSSQIADTVRSLRRAALQLEAMLEEAEANPSRMIFGDPPPRRTPGDTP